MSDFTPNLSLGDTDLIRAECARHGLTIAQTAYVLASAYHETAHTMKPVRETLAKTDDIAIARLERHFRDEVKAGTQKPYWRRDADGKTWLGRGHIQITWKSNYLRLGRRLGLDLVTDPDVVMDPKTSVKIMVIGCKEGLFTGKKLSDFITGERTDFHRARMVVNGMDRASLIAGYAVAYLAALRAAPPIKPAKPARGGALRRIARKARNRVAGRGLAALFRKVIR